MIVKVLDNQTLMDISIQVYGTIEGIYLLALSNELSITDYLQPGQILEIPNNDNINADTLGYYNKNLIKPTTGQSNLSIESIPLGIGAMIIGTNFRIG